MVGRPSVKVQDRNLFGKKVGRLRSQGMVPVNLVTPRSDSRALQTDERELVNLLNQIGQSGLIELKWENAEEVALIGEIHVHPVTRRVLHIVFRKIDLTKPIEVAIPIQFVGIAEAALASDRFVVNELLEVNVKCLPDLLPKTIEVDVSSLNQVGDVVRIESITPPDGVEILNDPNQITTRVELERAEEEISVDDALALASETTESDTAPGEEDPAAPTESDSTPSS